jgi:hypothetical protein
MPLEGVPCVCVRCKVVKRKEPSNVDHSTPPIDTIQPGDPGVLGVIFAKIELWSPYSCCKNKRERSAATEKVSLFGSSCRSHNRFAEVPSPKVQNGGCK